ncbi:MAG: GTP-binding protein [Sarcina sp.]
MKKLSEIKEDAVLIVEETVLTKEDILNDLNYYKNKDIYTTTEYKARIDAMDMLERAIESEYQDMYDDWDEEVLKDVTSEDIKELQVILDRILNRSKNIAYLEDEKIEVDIK